MQEEEDEHREELEEEVRQDEEDLQEDINDANEEIENGGTVNEDDFGDHDVDFDDDHSNENGDLDDSVTDITTDGDGAVDSDEPLPDPNLEEDEYNATSTSYSNETPAEDTTEYEGSEQNGDITGQQIWEYEEPLTNEQLVEEYIRSLEQGTSTEENGKSFSK